MFGLITAERYLSTRYCVGRYKESPSRHLSRFQVLTQNNGRNNAQTIIATHSPSRIKAKSAAASCSRNARVTDSACESRIPESTSRPHEAAINFGSKLTITSAVRLAQTTSAEGPASLSID